MWLTVQEHDLLRHIRETGYGALHDCQRTDEEITVSAKVVVHEQRLVECLRDYGHFRELKFADGLPMCMIVHTQTPNGVATGTKQIRLDKD